MLFLSGYLGLAASLYPYAIPPAITIWEAASRPETLRFTLWGACIVLPVVLAYTVYSYWVFRGKAAGGGRIRRIDFSPSECRRLACPLYAS